MVRLSDGAALAAFIGVPMFGGQIAGIICLKDVKNWYKKLKKPRWTPPTWSFPVVWPILYIGMGVSSFLVWKTKSPQAGQALGLYGAQLILNLLWQPIMFRAHRPDLALIDSTAMVGMATAATIQMAKVVDGPSRTAVISLMTPYLAWITLATALTAAIHKDNPNASKLDNSPLPEETKPADNMVAQAKSKAS